MNGKIIIGIDAGETEDMQSSTRTLSARMWRTY